MQTISSIQAFEVGSSKQLVLWRFCSCSAMTQYALGASQQPRYSTAQTSAVVNAQAQCVLNHLRVLIIPLRPQTSVHDKIIDATAAAALRLRARSKA
eukprot:18606-Heterococcus_DN1.PRE.2